MRRLMLALTLATLGFLPLVAQATPPPDCVSPEETELLGYVNNLRAERGLPGLKMSARLFHAAEHHSADMAAKNYFAHTLKDGTTWSQNIRNHGYTFTTYRGENIAAGSGSAYGAFTQWKNSPGHLANMVNPNYKVIGIGHVYDQASTYDHYWTQTFGGYVDGAACAVAAATSGSLGISASAGDAEMPALVPAESELPPTDLPSTGTGSG